MRAGILPPVNPAVTTPAIRALAWSRSRCTAERLIWRIGCISVAVEGAYSRTKSSDMAVSPMRRGGQAAWLLALGGELAEADRARRTW